MTTPESPSQSILSIIPLTKALRHAARQLRTLKLELEDDGIQAENGRVRTIQHMIDEGQHGAALRELLHDTHLDLQQFNKLRHCLDGEDGDSDGGDGGDGSNNNGDDNSDNDKSCPSPPQTKLCQWLGVDPNTNHRYHCINPCTMHPWKVHRNVHGNEEVLQMDFCPYHVRHCLDPMLRHEVGRSSSQNGVVEDLIEIQCPNKHGLCNGCFVQNCRHRPPPPGSVHIPGRRRLIEGLGQGGSFLDREKSNVDRTWSLENSNKD